MLKKTYKHVLSNGLTVLVKSVKNIPKVSVQLWYNVGSKDELSGQKGIAHLIEHMIFKGTEKLSECDINMITSKLSGYANAFTSYDYTGYLFNFPSQHWYEALPIMSDCMKNCTFKQEFLNSELKAVIQELKMYKDRYTSSLSESLISTIFYDHPYHHPIIGYKQDLWNLKRDSLIEFYEYHYIPNNATLVIVGDVDLDEVINLAEENFGHILPNWDYKKNKFYHSFDLLNFKVNLQRDIQQPVVMLTWSIPGVIKKQDYIINIISWMIGSGRGSRLYKKLINEYELVTDVEVFNYDLFDHGLLFIYFTPKKVDKINDIISIINDELNKIVREGISELEINRAVKKSESDYLVVLENNQNHAYAIGKYYLATGNEKYFDQYTEYPKEDLKKNVVEFIRENLIENVMHQGTLLPIEEIQRNNWLKIQELSDQEDQKILSGIKREAVLEEGKCVYSVTPKSPEKFKYPKADVFKLNNELKILNYNNLLLPKIDLVIDFKAKHFYDPINLQGLGLFVYEMLLEGTKNYSADAFADIVESCGMALEAYAGRINMSLLSSDFSKSLEFLLEILTKASFDNKNIEKVRNHLKVNLNQFWDEPTKFVRQLAKQEIYKNHPYSKNYLGTIEGIDKITRNDLVNYYNEYISPESTRLSISGDISSYDLNKCINSGLGSWNGDKVEDIKYPKLEEISYKEINYPIMRDQTVLGYAGLSTSRANPDYDKLLLFEQIFTGGVLGSMNSRLFKLREQTGLFYTIGGSLIDGAEFQPGMVFIKTIVSNDRLSEAEKAIENVIDIAAKDITEEELNEAKQAVVNSLVDNFATNYNIALSLLYHDKYNLPSDYFEKRMNQLTDISIDDIKLAVKKYLNLNKMVKIRVGRV